MQHFFSPYTEASSHMPTLEYVILLHYIFMFTCPSVKIQVHQECICQSAIGSKASVLQCQVFGNHFLCTNHIYWKPQAQILNYVLHESKKHTNHFHTIKLKYKFKSPFTTINEHIDTHTHIYTRHRPTYYSKNLIQHLPSFSWNTNFLHLYIEIDKR